MTEKELTDLWEREQPIYEAWGRFVITKLNERLSTKISPKEIEYFIKIWPPRPRIKESNSLVDKAFHRRKNYSNPYREITDKVGIRYVVLVTSNISAVEDSINEVTDWNASKDRDFEQEQARLPLQFDYQSVHYVVRALYDTEVGNYKVPRGTPCEIQIRTLLQHAHSEITHDDLFKSQIDTPPSALRSVAKSMALIEATNDYFEDVIRTINNDAAAVRERSNQLSAVYRSKVEKEPTPTRMNSLILEAYGNDVGDDLVSKMDRLLQINHYLAGKIRDRSQSKLLFRQPAILLVYLLAQQSPADTKFKWPLTPEELQPVYTDLGLNFDSI